MEQHKTPSNKENLFSANQICTIAGISRRQLQYWDKSSLINPSYRTEGGHGRYTFSDLIAIRAAKNLLTQGYLFNGYVKASDNSNTSSQR